MPNKTDKRKLGDLAEDKVVEYVKQKKWKVLCRNFEKPWGEIDIVARDKKTVVFIEVKASDVASSPDFSPEDHFDHNKKEKVIRTSHSYLVENKYAEDVDYRIDLAAVEIDLKLKVARIRYYKNAIG
ncbi:MAG: YraN family protein [Candidatus Spechtbacterales bacterium]